MLGDIEVRIEVAGGLKRVGTLHRQPRLAGGGAVSFQCHCDRLSEGARFSLEPALMLGRSAFSTQRATDLRLHRGLRARYVGAPPDAAHAEREGQATPAPMETDFSPSASRIAASRSLGHRSISLHRLDAQVQVPTPS